MTQLPTVLGRIAAAWAIAAAMVGLGASAPAAQTWDQLVEGAKKEGELVIHVGPGKQYRDGRLKGFQEAFPFLKLHVSNTANRESMPKLVRERQAGIYSLDVHFGGAPNLLRVYVPNGFVAPFRDALVLPELTEDKTWRNGFADGFMDKDGKYVYAYDRSVQASMYVNRDLVKEAAFKDLSELLKPGLDGKIVWHDPRSPGPGFSIAVLIFLNYGEEYLTKLFQRTDIVYTNNRRQVVEWVVRGRYPIGLGAGQYYVQVFQQQGIAKNVLPLPMESLKVAVAFSGNANILMMDKAPHPNAAKLYINWFLKREQQQQWADILERSSRRLDTKPGAEGVEPMPGVNYVDIFHHSQSATVAKVLKLARDTIQAARDKAGDDD
jgi:iron(III) transport system substrate-binding protein